MSPRYKYLCWIVGWGLILIGHTWLDAIVGFTIAIVPSLPWGDDDEDDWWDEFDSTDPKPDPVAARKMR